MDVTLQAFKAFGGASLLLWYFRIGKAWWAQAINALRFLSLVSQLNVYPRPDHTGPGFNDNWEFLWGLVTHSGSVCNHYSCGLASSFPFSFSTFRVRLSQLQTVSSSSPNLTTVVAAPLNTRPFTKMLYFMLLALLAGCCAGSLQVSFPRASSFSRMWPIW